MSSIYKVCPANSDEPWKVKNKEESFCMFSLFKELQAIEFANVSKHKTQVILLQLFLQV
jgi:hypothetical protein